MATSGSAKVTLTETDYSSYISGTSGLTAGFVGPARKGPLVPTLITGQRMLIDIFGTPISGDYSLLSAYIALNSCKSIYYMRVVHSVLGSEDGTFITSASKASAGNSEPTSVVAGSSASITLTMDEAVTIGSSGVVQIGEYYFSKESVGDSRSKFSTYAEFIALLESVEYITENFVVDSSFVEDGGVKTHTVVISVKEVGEDGNDVFLVFSFWNSRF